MSSDSVSALPSSTFDSVENALRVRVHLMSGDEAEFSSHAAHTIGDLKRIIAASQHAAFQIPVARQRLVLMPAYGGREPHEVLADARTLAQCRVGSDTVLELVVVDELPPFSLEDTDLIDKLAQEGNVDELCALLGARGGELTFVKEEVDYECGPYDDWPKRIECNRYAIGTHSTALATLTTALAGNPSVTAVNLAQNSLGDAGVALLIVALSANTCITTVNLAINGIGNAGAASIASALARNTAITAVDLSSNGIGNDGAVSLAAALATNSSVTALSLNNTLIGDEGVAALVAALASNTTLRKLDLFYARCSDAGRAALMAARAAHPAVALGMH